MTVNCFLHHHDPLLCKRTCTAAGFENTSKTPKIPIKKLHLNVSFRLLGVEKSHGNLKSHTKKWQVIIRAVKSFRKVVAIFLCDFSNDLNDFSDDLNDFSDLQKNQKNV